MPGKDRGVKNCRIETLLAGVPDGLPQRGRLGRITVPHRPVSMRQVKAAQQVLVQPLAGERQP